MVDASVNLRVQRAVRQAMGLRQKSYGNPRGRMPWYVGKIQREQSPASNPSPHGAPPHFHESVGQSTALAICQGGAKVDTRLTGSIQRTWRSSTEVGV